MSKGNGFDKEYRLHFEVEVRDNKIIIDRSACPLSLFPQISHADVLREVANQIDDHTGKPRLVLPV